MAARLSFSVCLLAQDKRDIGWASLAFAIPGATISKVADRSGLPISGAQLTNGVMTLPVGVIEPTCVTVEVPGDLVLQSDLDLKKFELERDKVLLEESNRRRTWLWSVGSAVLTALVTIAIAVLNKPDAKPSSSSGAPAADAVENCRASLKRLPMLAKSTGQTVAALSEAIDRHDANCDEVLVKVLGMR